MIRPHLETLLPIKVVSVKTQDAKQVLDHYCRDDLRQRTSRQLEKQIKDRPKRCRRKWLKWQEKKSAHVLFKLTRLTAMH